MTRSIIPRSFRPLPSGCTRSREGWSRIDIFAAARAHLAGLIIESRGWKSCESRCARLLLKLSETDDGMEGWWLPPSREIGANSRRVWSPVQHLPASLFFFHALLIDRAHPPFPPPFPRQTFIDTGKDIITISSIFLNGTQISSLAKEEGEFFPKTDSQFINNGTSP